MLIELTLYVCRQEEDTDAKCSKLAGGFGSLAVHVEVEDLRNGGLLRELHDEGSVDKTVK